LAASAVTTLTQKLQSGARGCLSVGDGGSSIFIYIMDGGIVGAERPEDCAEVLRRLSVGGALDMDDADELTETHASLASVMPLLLERVDEDLIERVLHDRFRNNLARFLGTRGAAHFETRDALWFDNVQVGHNAGQLIAGAAQMLQHAATVDKSIPLVAGETPPRDGMEGLIVELLGDGTSTQDLLPALPLEPIEGRALIARLLDDGVIEEIFDESDEPLSVSVSAPSTAARRDDAVVDEEEEEDADETTVSGRPVVDLNAVDEDILDDPSVLEPGTGTGMGAGASTGAPATLESWKSGFTAVDDDDLLAFADNEDDRSAGSGGFTTQTHNLDTVDVVDVADVGPPSRGEPVETELEAGEVTASFAKHALSEEDAEQKVVTANESLSAMCAAVDQAHGTGAGMAAVQLLVDGTPLRFKVLFAGLTVDEQGQLPTDGMLDNLYTRPVSEHRNLLSQGLIDLIERGLDIMGEDLPDEQFDAMYEAVAGYRQKLVF